MKRLLAALIVASLALVPASASAKSKTKVYRGTFALAGGDGDYATGNFGKVELVDGKRNDKLSVHVRRVGRRTKYTFQLQRDRCGGPKIAGWSNRRLKTNRKGVGNATGRSRTFTASKSAKYYVGVYDAKGDQLVLCARLSTKAKKGHGKPHKPAKKPHGKGHDKQHG